MSLSSKADKQHAKKEELADLRKKRSSKPPDNYGDQYVTGREKEITQGKGDNYRNIPGWYSDEVSERLEKIYGKKEETKETK